MSELHTTQRPRIDLPSGGDYIDAALEGLTRLDQVVLAEKRLPFLYRSGIRWRLERGPQRWRRADEVLAEGSSADCKNLACWRTAELRNLGIDRGAKAHVYRSGPRMWHCVVIRTNDAGGAPLRRDAHGHLVEDPSRILGMPVRESIGLVHYEPRREHMAEFTGEDYEDGEGGDDGEETGNEYIGADPSDSLDLTITHTKTATGWRTTVRIPLDELRKEARAIFIHREKRGKTSATRDALNVASGILKDPKVAALIPGPAKFALQVAGSDKAKQIAKGILSLI